MYPPPPSILLPGFVSSRFMHLSLWFSPPGLSPSHSSFTPHSCTSLASFRTRRNERQNGISLKPEEISMLMLDALIRDANYNLFPCLLILESAIDPNFLIRPHLHLPASLPTRIAAWPRSRLISTHADDTSLLPKQRYDPARQSSRPRLPPHAA